MSSKLFSILAVFVMLAMLLSACAQPAPAPAAPAAPAKAEATAAPAAKPAEQVEIRWRTRPDNQEEQDVYQKISDELQAKLPNIKLVYDPAPVQGYMDKLTTEYSAGTAPDIAWMPGASVADYASKGVLLDLMPEVSKDPAFKLTDFYDAPMKELQHDGKLWGLPRDISTMVMYYNKDLLKAKGVDDPADLAAKGEWTWDNFLKAAQKITGDGNYGFSFSNWWGLWGYFVYGGGGSLFNADRTACGLDQPGSIAGLQFMADIFNKYKVAPPPGAEGGVGETDFLAGKVGMFPNGRWMTPGMRQNAKFDWGVVEMPEGPAKATWLFWGPYVVSAKTKNPDAAWQVMKLLTSPEVQAQVAALGTNIPSNKDKAAVDAFLNSKPPADNSPFVKGADYAVAEIPLWTGNWDEIVNGIYQPLVDKLLGGTITAEEAGKEACLQANPKFTK